MTRGTHCVACRGGLAGVFPSGPAVVRLLIEAGVDPDAPVAGSWHSETPLRWAASSDDVDVADTAGFLRFPRPLSWHMMRRPWAPILEIMR